MDELPAIEMVLLFLIMSDHGIPSCLGGAESMRIPVHSSRPRDNLEQAYTV